MRSLKLTVLTALALLLPPLIGCPSGESDASEASAPPPPPPMELPGPQAEDADWKGRYMDLVNRQEELHVKFVAMQRENEELKQEVKELRGQIKGRTPPTPTQAPPPPVPTPPSAVSGAGPSTDTGLLLQETVTKLEELGADLFAVGEMEIAAAVFGIADDAGEVSAETLYMRGVCADAQGDREETRKFYEMCLDAMAGEEEKNIGLIADCLHNYAATLAALGEKDKAVRAYEDVIELAPDHAASYFNLGLMYAGLEGRKDDAVEAFRQHIARAGRRLASARRLIEKLQSEGALTE